MPLGKPAGMPCINLDPGSGLCRIWGSADYPATCHNFSAEPSVCGADRSDALRLIGQLERDTQ